MYRVFYAILMMSMEGGFIAVSVGVCFSLLPVRIFINRDHS